MTPDDLSTFMQKYDALIFSLVKKTGVSFDDAKQETARQYLENIGKYDPLKSKLTTYLLGKKGKVMQALRYQHSGFGTGDDVVVIDDQEPEKLDQLVVFVGNNYTENLLSLMRLSSDEVAKSLGITRRAVNYQRAKIRNNIKTMGDLFIGMENGMEGDV